jgi:glycolate oxidase FAD binding subunit
VSLPAGAPPLQLGAAALLEWNGMQRWLQSTAEPASIRARALKLGGHATLFRRNAAVPAAASLPGFALLAPATLALHRRLRAVFDPAGVFDFGRLVTEE